MLNSLHMISIEVKKYSVGKTALNLNWTCLVWFIFLMIELLHKSVTTNFHYLKKKKKKNKSHYSIYTMSQSHERNASAGGTDLPFPI